MLFNGWKKVWCISLKNSPSNVLDVVGSPRGVGDTSFLDDVEILRIDGMAWETGKYIRLKLKLKTLKHHFLIMV